MKKTLKNMEDVVVASGHLYPIRDALRHELSWTHYRSLTRVSDPIAREWYMNECIVSSWGTRALCGEVQDLPDEETLRREIEAQKELYRLQLQDMVEIEAETPSVAGTLRENNRRT